MSLKVLGFAQGPRTLKLGSVAKAAGVAVSFENIEFGKDNETDAWTKNCHPCQRVPVLDAGADGYIFESNAILRYFLRLGEKNGKQLYGTSPIEAAQVDQWIDFATNEVDSNGAPIYYASLGYLTLSAAEQDAKYTTLHHALCGLDTWLETRTFLVGERVTGADYAVASSVEFAISKLAKSADLWKYRNVVRHYLTTFHAGSAMSEASKLAGFTGYPVEKPKEEAKPKKEEPKKDAKPAAAAAAAGGDDDEDEEAAAAAAAPKKVNPLDLLPPSAFVIDAFKREYSNNKDTRVGVAKYLWDNLDTEGWTLWFCKYKYNDELTKVFMTSNLVRGWFQRMEGVRKYCFGIALTLGTEEKHEIGGLWLVRGTGDKLPECLLEVEDTVLFDWRKANLATDKDLVVDYLCWEGKNLGKPVLEGRCFK